LLRCTLGSGCSKWPKNAPKRLGHSDFELRRLARQAQVLKPTTREFFQAAGMATGMRVLDVGSGTGDVAFLAADLVGPSGNVVGTDIAPAAIAAARNAAIERAQAQVSFREGDPTEMVFEQPFDFIVGRYVLWSIADPSEMLRSLAKHLRPSGVILFHEPDWSFVRSEPVALTYDRCCRWVIDTFDRASTSGTNMSARVYRAFLGAGLPPPTMRMRTVVGDAVSAGEWLRAVADIAIVLLPAMEQHGVATSADLGSDTLADRIAQEVTSGGGIIIGRAEIGAWSQV
jgi:ubiquinone/menaquinone biosynthesis C-methylase UbiE